VALFSHGMAIKCALRGLLGSDPHRTNKVCIDNSSVTVLRHSGSTGWEVQRVNDTAHLCLF
jgi:broad specificity phosphatase PhoE